MSMELLFGKNGRVALLRLLAEKRGPFSISELSRLSGLPKATVSCIARDWENAGLAESEVQGRNKLVSLDRKCLFYSDIARLLKKSSDVNKPLLDKIASQKWLGLRAVKAVLAFGSRVKGGFSQKSDLDILVVLNGQNQKIEQDIRNELVKFTGNEGIRASPIIMDKKEFVERVKEGDNFAAGILKDGKPLKGRAWIGYLQTAA